MTVAIVAGYFPPHAGGMERYAYEMAKNLAKEKGVKVVVITSGEHNTDDGTEEMDGFTVHRLSYALKVSNTPIALSWIFKVRRLLKELNPDIVNIHTPVPGLGDIAAFWTPKGKIVVTYHGGSMRKGVLIPDIAVWLYEHIALPFLLSRASRIICSSDFIRYDFLHRYIAKSATITPGVDTTLFEPNLFVKNTDPTVLFVAGLSASEQHKGLHILMDAIALAKKTIPTIRLAIVGEGDMQQGYQEYAHTLGIGENVTFFGKLFGEALARKYQEAHVFSLPSKNESFGMVILEAMATGIPVVATNVGGIPTLVTEGVHGYLVSPNDSHALAEKIVYVLTHSSVAAKLGAKGKEKATAEFSWKERADAHLGIFRELMRVHIVHVVGYYPPHVGGMERVAEAAASRISKKGYRTTVITSSLGATAGMSHEDMQTVYRLKTLEFAHTPFAPTLLFHLLRLGKNSLIHFHLSQAYWPELTMLASSIRGIPYVAHFHLDVEPSGVLGPLFVIYKKIVWGPFLRRAKVVITCSKEMGEVVVQKYGVIASRITVIPNAVSEVFFENHTPPSYEGVLRLLFVGRLAPQKKIERIIEALALLSVPATLTIVGDGEERSRLEALVAEKHLSNVQFAGFKNDREMAEYHKVNDVFLISSDGEGGTPLVVLEAMAGGMPIVGTDVPGVRELLEGTGILVSLPYAESFASTLTMLAENPTHLRELSARSLKKAVGYTWSAFGDALEKLYIQL